MEPTSITSGASASWTASFPTYPAPTWALTYYLLGAAGKHQITATASGEDFAVSLTPTQTALFGAGVYQYNAIVTDGTEKHVVGTGYIEVQPNFETATATDTRSTARQTLEAIEAEILARARGGASVSYTILGRSISKEPMEALIKMRDYYKSQVRQEEAAERLEKGIRPHNKIVTRFTR